MLLYGGYKPQRIHKDGTPIATGPRREVYYLNFIRAHAPSSVNMINVSNAIFN